MDLSMTSMNSNLCILVQTNMLAYAVFFFHVIEYLGLYFREQSKMNIRN